MTATETLTLAEIEDLAFRALVKAGTSEANARPLAVATAMRGGTIHFERFAAVADADTCSNGSFDIEIQSTGAMLRVSAEESILDVLKASGIAVDFGCSEGLCGACLVDVLDGEVDHRDGILTPEEQATNSYLCTCVSRAKGDKLVLNL